MKQTNKWYKIQNSTETDTEETVAEVYIYDQIGETWWGEGVGAKTFAEEIDALDVDVLKVYLNSPGGLAYEGITIHNVLRRHRARVEITVDGLAASAASVIAMAGDEIIMNRGSEMMIHEAWSYAVGNETEMLDAAARLAKLSGSIADIYAARAGKSREHWRDLMKAESWYTAEEAVTAGLADRWVDAPAAAAAFDLTRFGFAFAGRAKSPAPGAAVRLLATQPEETNEKKEGSIMSDDTLAAGLRDRLGITDAGIEAESLLSALDERLAAPEPQEIPEGTVLVDQAAFAELQLNAAAGVEAKNELDNQRRESIVNSAIEKGKILPNSRDKWLKQLAENEEGTSELLESLPENTIPVQEIGTANEVSDDDRVYAQAWPGEEGA